MEEPLCKCSLSTMDKVRDRIAVTSRTYERELKMGAPHEARPILFYKMNESWFQTYPDRTMHNQRV